MAFDIIPKMKLPGEALAEGSSEMLKRMLENKWAEAKLAEEKRANDFMNQYRMGELSLNQELQPLKLDLLRRKIKNTQSEGVPELTKANITKNQQIIENANNVQPLIKQLIESKQRPGQTIGQYLHPSDQATYEAQVAQITDSLIAALNLPKTDTSTHLVQTMVKQKPFETESGYAKRLNGLLKDIDSRKQKAEKYLRTKNVFLDENSEFGGNESGGLPSEEEDKITIKNKKTGEIATVSRAEARKMGVPNV